MKKNAYIHDISDTFGDENTSKDALSIAKKIKKTQKRAFPSIEFKQHLGDRLSNIYALQSADDIAPRFSLMQLFGAFASFIFIAGGIFSFYQIHEIQDLKISPEHETLSIPSNSFEMKMIPMNEQDMQGLSIQDQELIPENNSNDPESFSVDTTDTTSNIFSDLCDTYMGSYDFETQICTLQYGTECSEYDEDTIFQCYSRDNTLSR